MILYSHLLYERISPWLDLFERENGYDVILFGLGRFGTGIARELRQRGHRVLGVDFDPDLVRRQEGYGYAVRYGDAEDPEFLTTLPLRQVRWVFSSLREIPVNLALLQGLHDHGYRGQVAVTAHSFQNIAQLKDAGADRVLVPYADAAAEAVDNLFGASGRQPSGMGDRNNTEDVM